MNFVNYLIVSLLVTFLSIGADDKVAEIKPYKSLKELSDDEIIRYMGEGKSEYHKAAEKNSLRIPKEFWEMEPKRAAFELIKINIQNFEDSNKYLNSPQILGNVPPENGFISYYLDGHIMGESLQYLNLSADSSYLVSVNLSQKNNTFLDFPDYKLKCVDFTKIESKHLVQTIWWLYKFGNESFLSETWDKQNDSAKSHTIYGNLSTNFGNNLANSESVAPINSWAFQKENQNNYDSKYFINLIHFLLNYAIPEYLKDRWSENELLFGRESIHKTRRVEQYSKKDREKICQVTKQVLEHYLKNNLYISKSLVGKYVHVAGEFAFSDLSQLIESVFQKMNLSDEQIKKILLIDTEFNAVNKKLELNRVEKKEYDSALSNEFLRLYKEQKELNKKFGRLYQEILLTRNRIVLSKDFESLLKISCSKDEGNLWALRFLRFNKSKDYIIALKWWLKNISDYRLKIIYSELNDIIPEEIVNFIDELPEELQNKIKKETFYGVEKANKLKDLNQRINELIKYAFEEKNWRVCDMAFNMLIPKENHLKYNSEEIDKKLLSVFDSNLSLACEGLVRRGKLEYFDKIKSEIPKSKTAYFHLRMLGYLTHLAQQYPEKLQDRLLEVLNPELENTKIRIPHLFNIIWSADLKSKIPFLELHASSSPDEFQSENANQSEGSAGRFVNGIYHQARKILALWKEEDDLTKGKLLISFVFQNLDLIHVHAKPDSEFRYKVELKKIYEKLDKNDRNKLIAFLEYLVEVGFKNKDDLKVIEKFVALTKMYLEIIPWDENLISIWN